MADVILTLRVLPQSIEVNLDRLEEKIKEKLQPEKIEREPIAFGLTALKIVKFVKDEAGEVEKCEKSLKEIEGIGEVEVISLTRSLG